MLKHKELVAELHNLIKELHYKKILRHLHSCLDEIVSTSLIRFSQLGMLTFNSYYNKAGARTEFVVSQRDSRAQIDPIL